MSRPGDSLRTPVLRTPGQAQTPMSLRSLAQPCTCHSPPLSRTGEHPDHVVVIKYVPYVGDSKRAMDEYTSEIFMGGKNTIVMHNTCEDSLLAAPIILDLVS